MRLQHIVVSDCHGPYPGGDSGAVALGHIEAIDGMHIDDYLIPMLQKRGIKVTRLTGSLKDAIAWLNCHTGIDMVIEVHKNAGGGEGVEVVYAAGDTEDQQKAATMSATMSKILGEKNRGAVSEANTPHHRLGLLHAGKVRFAYIIEAGFIDSSYDNAKSIWRYAYVVDQAIAAVFK